VRYKKRHIDKAWGPSPDRALRSSAKLEFTIYNNVGGKGSVCFDALALQTLPVDDDAPLMASASTHPVLAGTAGNAVDGNPETVFRGRVSQGSPVALMLDLGRSREFGGLTLDWSDTAYASRYRVALSDDGKTWRDVRQVTQGNGGRDWLALPESEARYVRLLLEQAPRDEFALAEATVQPLAFAATPNDFVKSIAKASPKGWFPRGFNDEQPYWTIVGIDGGEEQGLIGEDGAIEVAKGGFSIEPFVIADGKLVTWADVRTSQSLQDNYLPIPSVAWTHDAFGLRVTAFAQGTKQRSQLVMRYRLANTGKTPRSYVLALAARPLQVNPPSQFLNTVGGVSEIRSLVAREGRMSIDGALRIKANNKSIAAYATTFDAGDIVQRLAVSDWKNLLESEETTGVAYQGLGMREDNVTDHTGLASGVLLYRARLAPGETYEVDLVAPMTGGFESDGPPDPPMPGQDLQELVAAQWRAKLDRVHISVPAQGQALADTLRTATAHMLISRI
ncbi:MAG: discoidin domain-containing protein, partial [Candidatus Parcubacteria bacterium]|nr:discoidin domain-containing protein [Burkholderiales bacterium]